MPIVLHRSRIVFYPIPKNASTSIKTALFNLETGREFAAEPWRHNRKFGIHKIFNYAKRDGGKWLPYCDDYLSFAIVRDPVERFLSGYRSRVIKREDLKRSTLTLPVENLTKPELSIFVRHFDAYCTASPPVAHHFAGQREFIGNIIGRLTHVIPLSQIHELTQILAEHAGRTVEVPRMSLGARDVPTELSSSEKTWCQHYFRKDYEMLSTYLGDK